MTIVSCLYLQGFMITRSIRFGDCFYWKLPPECTTCLGQMAAAVQPNSPMEYRYQASLKPSERVIIKVYKIDHMSSHPFYSHPRKPQNDKGGSTVTDINPSPWGTLADWGKTHWCHDRRGTRWQRGHSHIFIITLHCQIWWTCTGWAVGFGTRFSWHLHRV